jgi:hypothetical protein
MSASSNVKVIGLDELNKLFAGFPAAFGKIFQQSGNTFAQAVYDRAYKLVPVKTGYLRSTIGVTTNQKEIRIYATAPYAAAVHDGARGRPGRPFLSTPVQENEQRFLDELGNGIMSYFNKTR